MGKKKEIKSYLKIVIIEDDSKRGIEGDFRGTFSNLKEMLFSMAKNDSKMREALLEVADYLLKIS